MNASWVRSARELGLAQHPEQVGVDLGVMPGEQVLDEGGRLVLVPDAAHRVIPAGRGERAAERIANVGGCWLGDHWYSVREG